MNCPCPYQIPAPRATTTLIGHLTISRGPTAILSFTFNPLAHLGWNEECDPFMGLVAPNQNMELTTFRYVPIPTVRRLREGNPNE